MFLFYDNFTNARRISSIQFLQIRVEATVDGVRAGREAGRGAELKHGL